MEKGKERARGKKNVKCLNKRMLLSVQFNIALVGPNEIILGPLLRRTLDTVKPDY